MSVHIFDYLPALMTKGFSTNSPVSTAGIPDEFFKGAHQSLLTGGQGGVFHKTGNGECFFQVNMKFAEKSLTVKNGIQIGEASNTSFEIQTRYSVRLEEGFIDFLDDQLSTVGLSHRTTYMHASLMPARIKTRAEEEIVILKLVDPINVKAIRPYLEFRQKPASAKGFMIDPNGTIIAEEARSEQLQMIIRGGNPITLDLKNPSLSKVPMGIEEIISRFFPLRLPEKDQELLALKCVEQCEELDVIIDGDAIITGYRKRTTNTEMKKVVVMPPPIIKK